MSDATTTRQLATAYAAVATEAGNYESLRRELDTREAVLREAVQRAKKVEGCDPAFLESLIGRPLAEIGA